MTNLTCKCGQSLRFSEKHRGKTLPCPACKASIVIPPPSPQNGYDKPSSKVATGGNHQAQNESRENAPGPRALLSFVSIVLAASALVIASGHAIIAFYANSLSDPLAEYDMSTPKTSLKALFEARAGADTFALAHIESLAGRSSAQDVVDTLRIEKDSDYHGSRVVFFTFRIDGEKEYRIQWFKKDPETTAWIPARLSTYDIDDDELKTEIEEWRARERD